ncbi:phosphotransferase [Bifidobacterium amazonense]|uniref:Phosphotransferase n=1 Tax=Bifidobacterium amazonense TaxID=2809027 RepID=A0ABS9VS63_9BIFI|nr:phosphotransferase [Bifidobacterium amazonense]MCH9274922.1 phosphotransferase [Bifidobacterium amazonense]
MLAALTSAAMPNIAVAGVRGDDQTSATDEESGIDHAVVQDAAGRLYDVFASDTDAGRKRLAGRVRAARTLAEAREPGGLGFALDRVLAFEAGAKKDGPTGETAVMVLVHRDGQARNLDLLTFDDCAAIGTAIGAIHRLAPSSVQSAGYPIFVTSQIRGQLTAWITRLKAAGHIPPEITDSWARILGTEGLWSFNTCFVHGGFDDGDVLYSGSTITAVTNWQNMQVNDPARDLAWIFAKLDEEHRNAVLAAYGRMMGARLDDLIMLRANLWLQMEQVGDFIQAINRADNVKIMQFKAQVDRLAHQLGIVTQRTKAASAASSRPSGGDAQSKPSTITVGTLLHEGERRRAAAQDARQAGQPAAGTSPVADDTAQTTVPSRTFAPAGMPYAGEGTDPDSTGDMDRTGSSDVVAAADETADRTPTSMPSADGRPSTSPTVVVSRAEVQAMMASIADELSDEAGGSHTTPDAAQPQYGQQSYAGQSASAQVPPSDDTASSQYPAAYAAQNGQMQQTEVPEAQYPAQTNYTEYPSAVDSTDYTMQADPAAQTILIPLLEQEERAMRDAQMGLATRTGMHPAAPGGDVNPASGVTMPVSYAPTGSAQITTVPSDGGPTADAANGTDYDDDDTGETTPKA